MAAAAHKVQLLADALALGFSQSLSSTQCCATLRHLLPGLECLSIAVRSPAQGGSFVAATNFAAEGPTTLHLHDPLTSAAGLALARTQPISVSLLNATSAKVVPALTDVQQMVLHAPTVTHLLCIPFGCGTSNSRDLDGVCHRHSSLGGGSGTGALLFGFSDLHAVDERRMAVLWLLAQCLPDPMARLSADTLQFVNFACGSGSQCTCCCPQGGEEEQDVAEEPGRVGGSCLPSTPGSRDDREAPSQALRARPTLAGPTGDSATEVADGAGWVAQRTFEAAEGNGSSSRAAAEAALEPNGQPGPRFSKALLVAVAGEQGALQQHPLLLTFQSKLAEQEYCRWISTKHSKGDVIFFMLLLMAIGIMGVTGPYGPTEHAPKSLLWGLGLATPLLLRHFNSAKYLSWREYLVAVFHLYAMLCIHMACLNSCKLCLPQDCGNPAMAFWRLTGAESLAMLAIGFGLRVRLHLPLGLASLALAVWKLPLMCGKCLPGLDTGICFRSGLTTAVLCGYLLPSAVLWQLERRSRCRFTHALRAAAPHVD